MSKKNKTIIEYRYYSLPVNFPVLLLSGDRWHISDLKSDRLHFHNCLEIGFCHSGQGTMDFENSSLNFKEGDITLVPRFLPHTTYSKAGTSSKWSYVFLSPEDLFKELFISPNTNIESFMTSFDISKFILSKEKYPKIELLVTSLIKELWEKNSFYKESAQGLLTTIYIELLRIYSAKSDSSELRSPLYQGESFLIAPALDYIHRNYMRPITIENLSDLCHISETHFRRTFTSIMGASPIEFINSTRIDEACKLLKSTKDTILSISEQVGFNSISSFNRHFVNLLNEPPREWRKKAIQDASPSATATILEFTGWL